MTEVVVMYSPRYIGARVHCSATEMTLLTARCRTGLVTGVPPKTAWSMAKLVMLAAVVAMPRATENWVNGESYSPSIA